MVPLPPCGGQGESRRFDGFGLVRGYSPEWNARVRAPGASPVTSACGARCVLSVGLRPHPHPQPNGRECGCRKLHIPRMPTIPQRGIMDQPRAQPWVCSRPSQRSPERATSSLCRPFRALTIGAATTQGDALGWHIPPFQGCTRAVVGSKHVGLGLGGKDLVRVATVSRVVPRRAMPDSAQLPDPVWPLLPSRSR